MVSVVSSVVFESIALSRSSRNMINSPDRESGGFSLLQMVANQFKTLDLALILL